MHTLLYVMCMDMDKPREIIFPERITILCDTFWTDNKYQYTTIQRIRKSVLKKSTVCCLTAMIKFFKHIWLYHEVIYMYAYICLCIYIDYEYFHGLNIQHIMKKLYDNIILICGYNKVGIRFLPRPV